MDTQLANQTSIITPVLENAGKFNDFLSSETMEPVRSGLKIIPDIIQDICDFCLENKKLKMYDKQFKIKADLFQQTIELQNANSLRKYELNKEQMRLNANIKNADINKARDITLAKIEANKQTQISKITSEEKIQLEEIKTKYNLEIKKQNDKYKAFVKILTESNTRFKARIKHLNKIQSDFNDIIKAITQKIINGNASEYEYDLLKHITTLLDKQCSEENFDITVGLINMFGGEY